MNNKKINVPSEFAYIFAIITLAFSVAMITVTDFGVSMIVAPAYILSQKVSFLTFGQGEYVIQAMLFIVFCLIMKKVKLVYFSAFITGVIYGFVLDLWRLLPVFNQDITTAADLGVVTRIIFFIIGMLLTSFSIATFFKCYLYPQVYDFFVKGMSKHFNIPRAKFKTCFDLSFLCLSTVMTLLLFHKFVGVNFGTLIMAVFNGTIIGFFNKFLDKHFEFVPIFKNFAKKFELE